MWALVVVASLLWGCTNPFLKYYSRGIKSTSGSAGADAWFLLSRPRYLAALAVNLMGSVAFYMAMTALQVSTVVPVVNALTFVMTGRRRL
jgi:hypothetical protein